MEKKQKEKKKNTKRMFWIFMETINGLLIGTGILFAIQSFRQIQKPIFSIGLLMELEIFLIGILLGMLLHIVIHEGGHLIFGFLTGYRFCSFRIMSFMWMKDRGKIRLKRIRVLGTLGQCLMAPPDLKDGKIPVIWYNLGGPILNLLTGLIFLCLFFVFRERPILGSWLLMMAIIGLSLWISNGIPVQTPMLSNDGCNARSLRKNPEEVYYFWQQLKINEQVSAGMRLKDMPKEWFAVPTDEAMEHNMAATIGVFACERLMDEHRFGEAERLMQHLLRLESGMAGVHRIALLIECMYLEMIGENRKEAVEAIRNKELEKNMLAMKKSLYVLRTEYAYALLVKQDITEAQMIKNRFNTVAKKHPYPSDVQSEWELMEIAERRWHREFS